MEPYNSPSPLPDPYGNLNPTPPPPLTTHEWQSAPKIVKGWAYPLTWLGIIALPFVIMGTLALASGLVPNNALRGQGIVLTVFYVILLALDIWLNRGLKKGTPSAWTVQIVVSGLALSGFLIRTLMQGYVPSQGVGALFGILIHGYILSQWFKPETKAWFGLSS